MKTSFGQITFGLLIVFCLTGSFAVPQSPRDVIRVQTRLVEVYATVYDHAGHYVDGLGREHFEVREDGKPQTIANFEANVDRLSCAILLDTTGSMAGVLPRVKNAVTKLIDELGPQDSVAIYSFDSQVTLRQEFTTDKPSAKRAVLRLRAEGSTALFDSISQTVQEISTQPGKKVLVVFTDGDDNASQLNSASAVNRAKRLGIPLYTIAEGEALDTPRLRKLLKELSESTGALSYEIKKAADIEPVFQEISHELQHLYLLTYRPPAGPASGQWRKIEVSVKGPGAYRIRAKQGYSIE